MDELNNMLIRGKIYVRNVLKTFPDLQSIEIRVHQFWLKNEFGKHARDV